MIPVNPRITWPTICIFGDSIVEGALDMDGGGWADRLKADWGHAGKPNIYNLGIDGDRASEVLQRFEVEVAARNPSTIIIAIGANDLQWTDREATNAATFQDQYERLLAKAIQYTQNILVLSILKVDEDAGGHGVTNAQVEAYNAIIEDVTTTTHIDYLDISGLLSKSELADGLHPNAQGHTKLYRTLKTELEHRGWDK